MSRSPKAVRRCAAHTRPKKNASRARHALADSRVREAEERKIAEEEARRREPAREAIDKTERGSGRSAQAG